MLTPRPYQLEGRDFLAARRVALLADEMRVGKTNQAIMAAHKAGARTVLVTCPAIAVPHWEAEFEKWWPSGPLPRRKIWSYDKARAQWESGASGTVDLFIPDEAHFAKNPEAKRTKMVYSKTGFAARAGATWALSGTPAPSHAAELWPMLRAFGVVGMHYDDFVRHYCTVNALTGLVNGTKVEKIPELKALLAKVMLRRMRKDVAPDMPAIGFEFLPIKVKADIAAVPAGISDDDLLEYLEAQAAVDREDRIAVAQAKVPALAEEIEFAIENCLLKQTVVFGWHKEPLQTLAATLGSHNITCALITGETSSARRVEIQNAFRRGEIKVIVANIKAAGTAIDLSAADHGYFLELWWVSGDNVQAANRLVSMEKKTPVTFDVCTMPGSVDDRVQKVLLRRVAQLSKLY